MTHWLFGVLIAFVLCCAFGSTTAHAQGETYYVDIEVENGTFDGSSWSNAFLTVQSALDVAGPDDEIWVAEGTYYPTNTEDRTISFEINGDQDGLKIYGGFDPDTGDTGFADRDRFANETILSGRIGNDIFFGPIRSHQVVVFAQNGDAGPSGGAITRDTVIDGFIIEEGSADTGYPYRNGGAIYINGRGSGNEASPTISNMVLRDNYGLNGGAVGIDGTQGGASSPLLTNVTFIRNQTPLDGGAIYGSGSGSPVIKNAVFVDNEAADLSGSGPNYAYGGAIASRAIPMEITNALFANNEGKRGGAIYSEGSLQLTNVTLTGNTAELGGSIFNTSSLTFENSISWGNSSTNTEDEILNSEIFGGTAQYTHSLVAGVDPSGAIDLGGNLDGTDAANAPDFPSPNTPAGSDGILATIDDGLRLGENSPAVDAGDNSLIGEPTDLTGRQRVQNGTVNLGPYEEAADTPERIYVDATATGAGDGTSWTDAHPNLQDALDRAGGNDRIWIAQGTYYPDEGASVTAGDRTARFYIPGANDGLQLYGGFDGTETDLNDRDVLANETVLSGDINQSGTATGNSYTVVQMQGQGASDPITVATTLADLTITAGTADGSGLLQERGAGLYCDGSGSGNACSPTLRNVVFANHTASFGGSALYNDGRSGGTASPQIEGVLFTGNTADVNGGAIYNYGRGGASSPTIVNTTFAGNEAGTSGGAMYNYAYTNGVANLTINNTIWYGNTADSDTDGTGAGEQIYNDGNGAVLNFRYSLFEGTSNDVESVNGASARYEDDRGVSVSPISVSTNVQDDPAFVDANAPAGPDNQFGTLDDGLRLSGTSPVSSQGENSAVPTNLSTDLLGESRIQNSRVSLGAYERISGIRLRLAASTGAETATFMLTHEGLNGVTGATVDLGLPAGITTPSATGDGSVSGGTWTVDVPANGTVGVVVDLQRDDSAPTGALDLTAQLDTDSYMINGGLRDATQPDDATADWNLLEAPYGPGTALTFDGTDDYLRADAVAAELANADAYTMSAWVRPTNTDTGQRGIVAFHTGTGGNKNMIFYRNERLAYYDPGIGYQESTTTYAPGTWHHVVVTVDASDNGTLYVDGSAEATFNTAVRPEAGDRFSIGQEWDGTTASDFFEGQIDEVRIWTAARTAAEVRASTYQTVPPESNDLAAYYRFDAAQADQRLGESYAGTQAYDLAHGLDASFEGDLQWTASGARLGQESIVVEAGNTASLGPAGAQLTLTSTGARTTLYRYGDPSADVFTDLDVPRKTTRSNAVWGAVPMGPADLELAYANVTVPNTEAVGLAARPYPANAWTARTEEPASQTFTLTGQTSAREFALYDNGPPFYYVDANASGAETGDSFADAFTDLQDALAIAKPGEIIVVAGGTYKPGSDRTDAFRIDGSQDGLTVAGGFEGTESFESVSAFEASLPARDFAANETILSGNLGIPGLSNDDAYHVLFIDGITSGPITNATTLNGLTITAGNADGSEANASGAGLYCNGGGPGNACAPTIRATQFVDNTATSDGGALYNNGSNGGSSSPRIIDTVFANNTAVRGGAVSNIGSDGTSSPELINTVFADNTADRGGAIYNDASDGTSSPTLANATLTGNTAAFGGAVYSSASGSGTSVPDIVNTILWDNTATDTGNDVYSTNGAVPVVRYTLVEDGCPADADCGDGSTLRTEDPLFAEANTPAGTDGVYVTSDDGLALTSASPALDAGDDSAVPAGITTDLIGEARIQDSNDDDTSAVTLGAYEQVPPPVLFVDANATGTGNGSSFENAYTTLQDALDEARGSNQIWIAAGTYRPTAEATTGEPRSATFEITDAKDGLQIYGGFSGDETLGGISDIEPVRNSRDISANPTILSGDIGTSGDPDDNAYHVIALRNLTAGVRIDGVIITAGNANGTAFAQDAGGGIYSNNSNLMLTNLVVTGNAASDEGGGLSASNNSTLHIIDGVFTSNSTDSEGGAMALTQSPAQMTNVAFAQNTAGDRGGALYANGSDTEITNATFTGNTAATFGNAFGNLFSTFTVTNSVLWGNGSPGDRQFFTGDPLTLDHTLVEGGESGIGGVGDVTYIASDGSDAGDFASSTNIDANPLFVSAPMPAGFDSQWATSDDGLRVAGNSPAVDAGDNSAVPSSLTTDLLGDPRIQDGDSDGTDAVTLGAYETPGLALTRSVTITGTDMGDESGWRIVGAPYTGTTAGDLRLTHEGTTSSPRFGMNVVQTWDDAAGGSVPTGDYVPAGADTDLPVGEGFLFYLTDDAITPVDASGITLSANRPDAALQSAQDVPVSVSSDARWHLLGNPYPTGYELSALTQDGQDLPSAGFHQDVQIYDVHAPGGASWVLLDSSTETLAPWQGVFIERSTPGTGPTDLTFGARGRVAPVPFIGTNAEASASQQDQQAMLRFTLTAEANGQRVARDEAIGIRFHEQATAGFDPYDTSKRDPLTSGAYALATPVGTGRDGSEVGKAVESRPNLPDDGDLTQIPVQLNTTGLAADAVLTFAVTDYDTPAEWAGELINTKGTTTPTDDAVVPLVSGAHLDIPVSELASYADEVPPLRVQVAPSQEALPVELAGFEAQRAGDDAITLQWETRSETNNAGFAVQRAASFANGRANASVETSQVETSQWGVSTTGESWQTIAHLNGAGTTDTPQSYRFEDTDLPYAADSLSYRLRQVDTDGTESFSDPVTIARQVTAAELLPTYPNPVRGQATVRFAVPDRQNVRIDLYDLLGRRIRTVVDHNVEGRTEQTLDVSGLASGTYFLRMQTPGHTETQRITVVR